MDIDSHKSNTDEQLSERIGEDSLEDESRAEATFQLVINDFSKFKDSRESRLSPTPCIVRNLPWKILAMSKQLNNREFVLGYFLQCNADCESTRWSVCASAELRLLHISDPEKNLVKKIQHHFYLKENDWGFSPFIPMKEIIDPEKGFYNAQNDSVTLEVWLNADAPHGTAWDSKKLTGFVGLTNQGATCYMNSLLQTLYFTNELRKAVYLMPTENDDQIKSVPYALQRVFYDLQFSDKSVGTKKLTRSFGWETLDTFMQHDVQELCRVLMDNLENKMKNTKVEGIIPRLFEGKMISYVKCKTIDYESRRIEGFYDIQLNIKDKKTIYDSFKDYITVESLDGENKYDAGKFGLQEAQKGVIFDTFPPVLHLHLMRFQYDPQTDSNIKINDRYEFYEKIQLDPFLEKAQSTPANYTLHAVLVHSGDNHGGHYVVFISPNLDGKWFKFDDEVVSRCSKKDAIDANFGGNSSEEANFRHSTNAYMLVYVRDSHGHLALNHVQKSDIPEPLQDKLANEKRLESLRKKERNEAHLYMQVSIVLEKDFYDHLGYPDLFEVSKIEDNKQLKVKKTSTMQDVVSQVAESLEHSVESIRIWSVMSRYNNTIRPLDSIELRDVANKTILDISKQDANWLIFVETTSDLSFSASFDYQLLLNTSLTADSRSQLIQQAQLRQKQAAPVAHKLPPYNSKEEVMIFFKYYDATKGTLRYVFRLHLPITSTLNTLQEKINTKMRFAADTQLLFFEEVKISQITPLLQRDIPLETLAHEQLLDGDIYVFQKCEQQQQQPLVTSPPAAAALVGNGESPAKAPKFPTVVEYFRDLMFQVHITFCDKNAPNDEGFTKVLSLKTKYDELAKMVGEHLDHDPQKLQFFRSNSYELKAPVAQAIKYNPEFQLKEAFNLATNKQQQQQQQAQQQQLQSKKLYYSKLTIKISELEDRRAFKCVWLSGNHKVERELMLMPFKKASVLELLNECRLELLKEKLIGQAECDDTVGFRLRLLEIVASKIHRVLKDELCIDTLDTQAVNKIYRVESVPGDELALSARNLASNVPVGDEYLLPVAHFTKDIYATFGSPFLLKIRQGELFKDIKKRIQRKLDVSDKDFAVYRYALVNMGTASILNSDDDDLLFDLSSMSGVQQWLGIDHVNKSANKKGRFSIIEKAIKIFN